jgi:hypothetical protein
VLVYDRRAAKFWWWRQLTFGGSPIVKIKVLGAWLYGRLKSFPNQVKQLWNCPISCGISRALIINGDAVVAITPRLLRDLYEGVRDTFPMFYEFLRPVTLTALGGGLEPGPGIWGIFGVRKPALRALDKKQPNVLIL